MAVALFHGSISRSRAAASSAPAKFGMRPCGGNGKRATPSAASLSQTHCRAALLSPKSRAMTESGTALPGDSQGRDPAKIGVAAAGRPEAPRAEPRGHWRSGAGTSGSDTRSRLGARPEIRAGQAAIRAQRVSQVRRRLDGTYHPNSGVRSRLIIGSASRRFLNRGRSWPARRSTNRPRSASATPPACTAWRGKADHPCLKRKPALPWRALRFGL